MAMLLFPPLWMPTGVLPTNHGPPESPGWLAADTTTKTALQVPPHMLEGGWYAMLVIVPHAHPVVFPRWHAHEPCATDPGAPYWNVVDDARK
ncbi:hypothetical protein ASF78_06225 [Cellulomonas sp. Leaf334]|nr:hypothetical protein ASF78_06225 [Cellulomonas sp. Leaf334]